MAIFPETQFIDLDPNDGWLTVWFNQPERRNPLTDQVVQELIQLCDALVDSQEIRGLTIRGRGGFFCAGGDLKGFQTMAQGESAAAIATSEMIGDLLARVNTLPQVTIALLEGAAMAGGLGLACCCDVTIGTTDTRFAFTETSIGISPAQIARFVLQKCGYATGRRLMLTAARFKGEEAKAQGLLDHVVANSADLEAAERVIRRDVLACAPGAVAATKALITQLASIPDDQKVAFAADNFTQCLQSDEGKEGVASFLEKRKPLWYKEI